MQHLSYFHPGETSLKLQLPEELLYPYAPTFTAYQKEIDTYQPGNVHMLRALLYEALMLLDRCYQKTLSAIGNETLTGSKENNKSLHRAVYKTGGRELERAAFRAILCRLPLHYSQLSE